MNISSLKFSSKPIYFYKIFKANKSEADRKTLMSFYQLKETKTGVYTLIYEGENTPKIRLHSAFDPETEAARAAENFEKGRARHILVLGLGLAYHIAALKKKYPDAEIIAFERDSKVVDLAREFNGETINNIKIINSAQELIAFFEGFDIGNFRGIAVFTHRPSHQIDPAFYTELTGVLKEQISSRVSDTLTRFEFEERWIENIFANIDLMGTALPVSKLFGKFKKCPGVIVSAGPSLRKNIEYLKTMKNKAIIVCVDTAYKICLRSGITPHIVMTLDAQKHSVKHFAGTGSQAMLLADVVSSPAILRSYGGHKSISSTSKYFNTSDGQTIRETTPIMDWIEERISPPGDIQSGGSVATSAFDLLLNMGCDPVILTGQDLAYTGREIHCAGTHHNDDWLPTCTRVKNLDTINQSVIRRRRVNYAEAYGGHGTVITDFVLDLYRGWFQDSALRVPFKTINATEGGARIKNTVEMPLASLASSLPEFPATETLASIIKTYSGTSTKRLTSDLIKAKNALKKLESMTVTSENGTLPFEAIEKFAIEHKIDGLINPLLRKTLFYIDRHNLDTNKASNMLSRDALGAVQKLTQLIEKALLRFPKD